MTVTNGGDPEGDISCPVSTIYEGEVQCCDKDHQEDGVSGEVGSHCGGECCVDDEGDCESNAGNCKDSCCGHEGDHSIVEEPRLEKDRRGEEGVPGKAESHCGGPGCCADDEGDCGSNLDNCKDSCCGHGEDHSAVEEFVCKDPRGTNRPSSRVGERFLTDTG